MLSSKLILIDQIREIQRQLGLSMQNIINSLNPNHKTMVLIRNLILPTPKPATTPHILGLQRRQNLGQPPVTLQCGGGVSMGEFTMVDADDFVVGGEEGGVYGALDGVCDEGLGVDGFHA
jgi:hypothetical protein